MLDKTPTSTQQQSLAEKKSFSFGLLYGAARGKLSTRRRTISAHAKGEGDVQTVAQSVDEVLVEHKNTGPQSPAVTIDNAPQPPLPSDRIEINPRDFFTATSGRKQLLITASAAKSLMRLFAALSIEPGSGREVPAQIRTRILNELIGNVHLLTDKVCKIIVGEKRNPPTYLRAKLIQQASEFVSEQWIRHGVIDTRDLEELTEKAFSGEVSNLNQDVVDLFHIAGEFTPANSEEISQARITESVVRATWSLYRQVTHFDLNDYDPNPDLEGGPQPFSYGRDPHEVTKDLIKITLGITRENALDIDHMDLATTWTQNSIDRACTLVRAEYRMLTDRVLRSSFKEELMSEAAIQAAVGMYDKILDRIQERARNGFIIVERNAVEAMSAHAYHHYLPKQNKQKTHNPVESQQTQLEPKVDHFKTEDAPSKEKTSRFSFARQNHA